METVVECVQGDEIVRGEVGGDEEEDFVGEVEEWHCGGCGG